ncbi:MAG: YdcF family protein [Betaproteobacteria bacterium]|nr:YdcF family protein [Betaproteobacteria bacterium]
MNDTVWILTNLIKALVLPPTPLLILALLGMLAAGKRRWLRRTGIAALVLLAVLSTAAMGGALLGMLEGGAPPLAAGRIPGLKAEAEAIVILGGGRRLGALDEPDGETVSAETLTRTLYGARLAHASGLPVIVSGGKPGGRGNLPEARLMARVLRGDLGVKEVRAEESSYDTLQNAILVARLMGGAKGRRIVLVTHFYHMRGAAMAFAAQGFKVIPAPMGHRTSIPGGVLDYLPSSDGLRDSSLALREFLRALWYAAGL